MSLSATEQDLIKKELLRQEAEQLRKQRQKLTVYDFQPLSIIGKGAYGEVRLCKVKATGEVIAMKRMKKTEMKFKNQVKHIKAERDVLTRAAQSPWIVELKYSFQDAHCLYLGMEYLPGGDLMTLLMKKEILSEEEGRFYAAEILLGIEATHQLNYIHRDIKPDNILLDARGHVKLSDFGLCSYAVRLTQEIVPHSFTLRRSQEDPELPQPSLATLPTQSFQRSRQYAQSTVGTPDYIAPEVLTKRGYDHTADWWSYGAILFEMLVGYPPFYSDDPTMTCRKIVDWRRTLRIPANAGLSGAATDLLLRLLRDPQDRLGQHGVAEIKAHPFFTGIDWSNLQAMRPPFVPELVSEVDTANFERFEEDEPFYPDENRQPLRRDMEFIGYTFKKEVRADALTAAFEELEKLKTHLQDTTAKTVNTG